MSYSQSDDLSSGSEGESPQKLTPRQREVAELIVQGLTNDQIAQRLTLTPGTVANHVAHVLIHLGLRSRVQIAAELTRENHVRQADQVLVLLECLRHSDARDLTGAFQHAADVLTTVFAADKVDCFMYDGPHEMLTSIGTSNTPLGRRQHELDLHRLPVFHGGRVAWVFQEHRPFIDGHVEDDPFELLGVRKDLGIRSSLAVPLDLDLEQHGVLMVASARPEHFVPSQLRLLQFVAYWVGLVVQDRPSDLDGTDVKRD